MWYAVGVTAWWTAYTSPDAITAASAIWGVYMLPALAAGLAAVAAGILAGPAVGLGIAGIAAPRPAARPETARARLARTRATPDGLRAEAREAREAADRIERSEWIPAATISSLVHTLLDKADWLDEQAFRLDPDTALARLYRAA